jgi:23S rRNA (cytidine1920-2'-O)/16S rRNA (cytidine1409-2'-O)-methyltransferase
MKPSPKKRIDQLIVEQGLAESRQKAQALIMSGEVTVNGQRAEKPGQLAAADSSINIGQPQQFVGRGGLKMEAALDQFHINVAGKVCLDVGSSTGGFTDCLLQRGAARVHAVDVGTNQLDWRLRSDPRVVVHEQLNARYLKFEDIGELADIAVCDVSFISVALIVPVIPPLLRDNAEMVILVKPQFEVGRGEVGKGGIVRDPGLHAAVCQKIESLVRELGFQTAIIDSPILGAEGNREFLLHASNRGN